MTYYDYKTQLSSKQLCYSFNRFSVASYERHMEVLDKIYSTSPATNAIHSIGWGILTGLFLKSEIRHFWSAQRKPKWQKKS